MDPDLMTVMHFNSFVHQNKRKALADWTSAFAHCQQKCCKKIKHKNRCGMYTSSSRVRPLGATNINANFHENPSNSY